MVFFMLKLGSPETTFLFQRHSTEQKRPETCLQKQINERRKQRCSILFALRDPQTCIFSDHAANHIQHKRNSIAVAQLGTVRFFPLLAGVYR